MTKPLEEADESSSLLPALFNDLRGDEADGFTFRPGMTTTSTSLFEVEAEAEVGEAEEEEHWPIPFEMTD